MIRRYLAPTEEDVPHDPVMRLVEVGVAILAIAAAAVLALIR